MNNGIYDLINNYLSIFNGGEIYFRYSTFRPLYSCVPFEEHTLK